MQAILYAALAMGGMGLVFGILIYLAGRAFAVPHNAEREAVRGALPGANCGACGYAGCDGYAAAVAEGTAAPNLCPVGGAAVAQAIAQIMGVDAGEMVTMVSTLKCQGSLDHCRAKYIYEGTEDCLAASQVMGGNKSCQYACLGLGTCAKACQFGAITMDERLQIAIIDPEKCTGCRQCVSVCPKKVLEMQPADRPVKLLCSAAEAGKLVSNNCRTGCIGCEMCRESCKFGAITMKDHLPQIDNEKCVGCMMCAEVCPTTAIWGDFTNRKEAVIDRTACIGCGICKKTCQFEAIAGERKYPHEITQACTGCGQCVEKCPKKCITLRPRRQPRDAQASIDSILASGGEAAEKKEA